MAGPQKKAKQTNGFFPDEETMQQLSVYDNVSHIRPKKAKRDFLTLGKVVAPLARSREDFQDVKERKLPERERVERKVPRPNENIIRTWTCERCDLPTDGETLHGWLRNPRGDLVACPKCSPPVRAAQNRLKVGGYIADLVGQRVFLDKTNLPVNAERYSFTDYPGDQAYIDVVQRFVRGEVRYLLLTGGTGVGKTGLAISAVHELSTQGKQVLFITMGQYLDLLDNNTDYRAVNNHIREILHGVEILVLDELGVGEKEEISETQQIIELRYSLGLRTLITSNMTVDGLAAFWYNRRYEASNFQPGMRPVSRLKGWYRSVEMVGRDLRVEE